jgi:type II restriction enzyme
MGLLRPLLVDKTTKGHILWATDAYRKRGPEYQRDREIQAAAITGGHSDVIKTRARKALEQQSERTRRHAEVFTPLWVCRKMVSHADEVWFSGADPFRQDAQATGPISFPRRKRWQRYVDARRLEITCGEAPYLVNRYDVSTGEEIPLENRSGILDRKLQVVGENAADEDEWVKWALRACQATYGYEFQGDNLLIARVNLLMTYEEYCYERWQRKPTTKEYRDIVRTISWNIWQMDGLNGMIPYSKAAAEYEQESLFDWLEDCGKSQKKQPCCRIYDWRRQGSHEYLTVHEGSRPMRFDFVIGNPPYQDDTIGDNKGFAPPIYHKFLDNAFKVANAVELIHPARFLFNAGSTPKAWNNKMLKDEHFKILYYESDASKIFPNTDIKGGVVISYRDLRCDFGSINVFTKFIELNTVLHKVITKNKFISMKDIVVTRTAYRLTAVLHRDHPEAIACLSEGHAYDMSTNIFERLPQVFNSDCPSDSHSYIQILGREKNERVYKYIRRDYVNKVKNLDKYKIFIPKANGVGKFGELLSSPMVVPPKIGSTETFLSIGAFVAKNEAESAFKYIKTKFARSLLGVLKTTQDITPEKWKYVPLQDFTPSSDIDWSKSVAEIDQQLYAKYGLDEKEIAFIESHVKEMA